MPDTMPQFDLMLFLGLLSEYSTQLIFAFFAVHLVWIAILWLWWRRHLHVLANCMDDFTRGLKHRSGLDRWCHPTEQIEAFLADVRDVMSGPKDSPDRAALQIRIRIFDEKRRYLNSYLFETCNDLSRTMIEIYPLLGILGTLLAMGVGLATRAAGNSASSATMLTSRLGEAIWSTVAGLIASVFLMLINSLLDARFQRLHENRIAIREAVHHVKRELSTSGGSL